MNVKKIYNWIIFYLNGEIRVLSVQHSAKMLFIIIVIIINCEKLSKNYVIISIFHRILNETYI